MKKRVRFHRFLRRAALPAALTLGALSPAVAQNELSNFSATGRGGVVNTFATDYQALGVNPANLGRSTGVKVAFTLMEAGAGVSSRTANRSIFNKFIFNTEKHFENDAERKEVAAAFTGKSAINIDGAVTLLGVSFYHPAAGGFALNTRYRMVGQADLGHDAADLLFRGNNADVIKDHRVDKKYPLASVALKDTRIQMSTVQEINFGYGREIYKGEGVELYGGVGIKYLRGIGILDLTVTDGKLSAYGALSPVYEAVYPTTLTQAQDFNQKLKSGSSAYFPSVGSGVGYDLGLSALVAGKVRLSASVVDLGKMTWKANSLEMVDTQIKPLKGTSDYVEGPITYNLWKAMKLFQAAGDSATGPFVTYKPGGKREVKLPARMRFGIGAEIGEHFAVGFDAQMPFDNKIPGSYKSALVGAGLDYKPIWWLQLSSGLTGGGGFGFGLPLGVAVVRHSYEMGFGTRNVLGWVGEKNPYLSLAFGFLRFKIGHPENTM